MSKTKKYKNVEEFSQEVLSLDDYEYWLVATKNRIIAMIVETRKKQEISQKELASMFGTTQSVISRIERGSSRHITIDYLMKVANTLGISSKITLKKVA